MTGKISDDFVQQSLSPNTNAENDDLSATASDAAIAGNSVATTEAEEDALSSVTDSAASAGETATSKKAILITGRNFEQLKETIEDDDDSSNAAPMHLHVLRTPARLRGNPGARSRSSSRSRPGSRKNSVSPSRSPIEGIPISSLLSGSGGLTLKATLDNISANSSLDGAGDNEDTATLDPDILLDKMGFRDLDLSASQAELRDLLSKHCSSSSLPTLNERLSEESLDDVHAFQDLVFVRKSSDGLSKKKSQVVPINTSLDISGTKTDLSLKPEEIALKESSGAAVDSISGFNPKELLLATHKSGRSISSPALMSNTSYSLNTLDEELEEEEEEEQEDEDYDGKSATTSNSPDDSKDSLALLPPCHSKNICHVTNSEVIGDKSLEISKISEIE